MPDIFQIGQEGSKSKFIAALQSLQDQGSTVLNMMETSRLDTLVEFDRRLQAINARRVRSGRVAAQEQAIKFVVSDFTDIDQANTTGTVRADSSSVSLKERAIPAEAVIKTKTFTANKGTIEALDAAQDILRVHTDDGSTPTGQFDIELVTPLSINQLIFDIVASPSTPRITALTSPDGLTYSASTKVAISGYRVNAWLTSQEVRFIRVQVIPSHPDELNGTSWSFGITSFSAQSTDYHLRSELVTQVLSFVPKSEFVAFNAPIDSNIQYYLSINDATTDAGPFVEIKPGDFIHIGTSSVSTVVTSGGDPSLIATVPFTVYMNTVQIKEGSRVTRFAPGLSQDDSRITSLVNEYVGTYTGLAGPTGIDLRLVRADGTYTTPRTFNLAYVFGPALINVRLRIRLSTSDRAISPIFHGATLDEV